MRNFRGLFRREAKLLTATSRQPENFYLAIEKYKDRLDFTKTTMYLVGVTEL